MQWSFAGFTAMEATEYNYLSHWQQAQYARERQQCDDSLCVAKTMLKWSAISGLQEVAFANGLLASGPDALKETGEGLYHLVEQIATHPQESYQALKDFIARDDKLSVVTGAVKQGYLDRLDRFASEYEKAGAKGAYEAGKEFGKLAIEIGGLIAGGVEVAKGAVKLGEVLTQISIKKPPLAGKRDNPLAHNAADAIIKNKPLGLGSTGRTNPANLKEQLAMQEVMSNPVKGILLEDISMTDKRWPASEGWVKMAKNVNGIEIHYLRNIKTGAVDDFKFK